MYYKITIEGGFTGIPKEYTGEIDLDKGVRKKIVRALGASLPSNDQMRDGLRYHVELEDEKGVFKGDFDESNLPSEIRSFIDSMAK